MVELRKASLDDIKLTRDILKAVAADLTARFGEGHWSGVRSVETLQRYAGSGVLYIVEDDTMPIGTLRLTDRKIGFYKQDWFVHPRDPAGYLMDMAIHPDHQRRGIGRQAMRLAEQLARRAGLRAIRLDAYKGPAGAGGFYRCYGYALVHAGEMKGVGLEYFEKLLSSH